MNKTYCFTDIHGNYNLWKQISEYCDETDTIYYLGDAIDRGPDGLKIAVELLKDPRVIYLKGNHEEFMEDELPMMIDNPWYFPQLWSQNGGDPTIESVKELSEESKEWLYNKISNLPIDYTFSNKNNQIIHLTHAGSTPGFKLGENESYPDYYLWDRDHIYDEWPAAYENYYEVHGHTPVPYIALALDCDIEVGEDEYWNILKYCDNHKIDLDLGTILTNKIALFDLDTLSIEKYFYDSKKGE